jgi:hypothetical protein
LIRKIPKSSSQWERFVSQTKVFESTSRQRRYEQKANQSQYEDRVTFGPDDDNVEDGDGDDGDDVDDEEVEEDNNAHVSFAAIGGSLLRVLEKVDAGGAGCCIQTT